MGKIAYTFLRMNMRYLKHKVQGLAFNKGVYCLIHILVYFCMFTCLPPPCFSPSLRPSSPLIELPFPLERKRWREGEVGLSSVHNLEPIFSHLECVFLGSEIFIV